MIESILGSLDEATARRLKLLAWRQGLTLRDFVCQVLERHVNNSSTCQTSKAASAESAPFHAVQSCHAAEH
jgi:hypothetical protein